MMQQVHANRLIGAMVNLFRWYRHANMVNLLRLLRGTPYDIKANHAVQPTTIFDAKKTNKPIPNKFPI